MKMSLVTFVIHSDVNPNEDDQESPVLEKKQKKEPAEKHGG